MNLLGYIRDRNISTLSPPAYSERDRTHEELKLRTLMKGSWKIISYQKKKGELRRKISTFLPLLKDFEFSMVSGAIRAGKNYIRRKIRNISRKRSELVDGEYLELFDLSVDPFEKHNLANRGYDDMKEKMRLNLKEFMEGRGEFRSEEKIEMEKTLTDRLKALGYID
jgi:hypothetical protein